MAIETLKSLAVEAGHGGMWRDDSPSGIPGQSLENPMTSWDRIFDTPKSYSSKSVTEITALQLAAVWRCVSIISGAVARTPFLPYRRNDKGRTIARDHYLFPLLTIEANPWMTAYRFKRLMQARVCLWGNAYALIIENGRGQITELWPMRPDKMTVREKFDTNGNVSGLLYVYTTPAGQQVPYAAREILHIRGLETDGVKGLSPISANRQAIGLGMAAEEYGARYFGQGIHPGGWISHPGVLGAQARKNIMESLNDLHGGLQGSHKLAVLEENMQYKEVGIPPEDMQFLQTRQFQAIDIARLFGVPPHMIAELSRATFSNIEHQSIEFVGTCLDDWFMNWQNEFMCALLSPRELGINGTLPTGSIELDFYEQKLLKGDRKSRFDTYSVGIQNRIISTNEAREDEGLNRIDEPWADEILQPLNMVVAGTDPAEPVDPDVVEDDDPAGEVGESEIPGIAPLKTDKENKYASHSAALNGNHR